MKGVILLLIVLLGGLFAGWWVYQIDFQGLRGNTTLNIIKTEHMDIFSRDFKNLEDIPAKFTCDADNISPFLSFSNVPKEAVSLVLIVDDPDSPVSPTPGGWVHWIVWNIPPDISSLDEGALPPSSVEGVNDFGKIGYGGPCPATGVHRYYFKLYALSEKLSLDVGASKLDLLKEMEGKILDEAKLVGKYKKSN